MSAMQDMTKGGAAGHLLRYAVPLMLGNWFQLAYNAVDSIIAGRFIGKDALAAEGIAGPVMNLVILGITGVCLGAGVLMSEFFGAKDGESLRRELATTVLSGTAACTVVALLGVLFTPAILQACAVPREIFAITAIYLRITFLGAPFTCFYNALAAGFKSVGDARTPLRFLMVSAILNAALDLIFIGGLGFGIVCSAMTTVIAEAFSAVLAGWWLWTKTPELCPRRGQWRVDRSLLGRTLQYGGVSALQQAVQPIGKVLIQGQVNALGVEVIAAFNAVTRIDDFACIPEQSIAQGITTYIAQNRGAGRQDRIRRGFAVGLGMEAAYWMLIGGVVTLFKTPLAAMFVTGEGADRVIALAVQYLGTMALFYLLPAMTNGFQGYYRGMGNMPMTLLGTLIQTSLRVVTTCILAPRMGMYGIAFACAAMAGVFATSAFAANDAQVARAQDYLNSKGIAYTVTASDVDKAVAAGYTADALVAKANALLNQAKSDPEGAKNEAVNVLNSIGVSVADAKVAVNGNDITISASINGTNVAYSFNNADTHPEIGEAIKNGTWGVAESTTTAAASLKSGNGVIKATGDNAGIAMLVAVVAIAGTMGVAVRKSRDAE